MRPKGILIVDDDDAVLIMVSEWLTQYGYKVFASENIKGAIAAFKKHRDEIDLLMTDVKLRNENGFDLSEILEQDFGFSDHVFFTSFFWEQETAERLINSGKPYFEKPLKFNREILPFLERYFARENDES
jgi:CheY-like chemotaxis protein